MKFFGIMSHYLDDVIRLVGVVFIVCSQLDAINSKSSILWKLNVESGLIDAFDEDTSRVSSVEVCGCVVHDWNLLV